MKRELLETYYIDLGHCTSFNEAFEHIKANKDTITAVGEIVLNFGNLVLTQGHIKYVEMFLKDNNVQLKEVHSSNVNTQLAALSCGLSVSENSAGEDVEEIVNQLEEDMLLVMNSEPTILETVEEISDEEEPFVGEDEAVSEIKEDFGMKLQQGKNVSSVATPIGKLTNALYVKQTLRSGQVVRHHADVVIIGDVHPGSEVIADGDIIVWGVLGGLAHAGVNGNKKAQIRALRIDAIQLRIANYFARCPDHIKTDKSVRVELARVEDDMIKIYKL